MHFPSYRYLFKLFDLFFRDLISHFSFPAVRHQARRSLRTGSRPFTLRVPRLWPGSTTERTRSDCCELRSASWSRRSTWTRRWRRWETCSCLLSLTPRRGRPSWNRYRAGGTGTQLAQWDCELVILHVYVMLTSTWWDALWCKSTHGSLKMHSIILVLNHFYYKIF